MNTEAERLAFSEDCSGIHSEQTFQVSTFGNSPMNDSEAIAKRVLEAILPGARLEYKPVQSNGEYDFHLRYADGTVAAVEVTAAVDKDLLDTVAARHGKRAGGPVIQAVFCKKSWVIHAAKGPSFPGIRKNADQFLAKLEGEGINGFDYFDQWKPGCSQTVRELCCQLGVTEGYVLSSAGEPMIKVECPIEGRVVGASLAIEAVEKVAWKPDNRQKLGAAKTNERHFVVYMGPGLGQPGIPLAGFSLPPALPKHSTDCPAPGCYGEAGGCIPQEITNLWLIGRGEEANELAIWRAGISEAWRSTRVICTPETSDQQSSCQVR